MRAAGATVPVYRLAVAQGRQGRGRRRRLGGAIQCGQFCADRLDAGTIVTLTAAPLRGSRFVRWRGGCRGTRPFCALRIAGPTTAIAVFVRRAP